MPGLFTPPPLQRCEPQPRLFEPVPRFQPGSSETSGLQLTTDDHATRKRSRYDNVDMQGSAFTFTANTPHTRTWTYSLGYSRSAVRSPPPLANDRYELAGGSEVTDKFARQDGNSDDYFHLEKQRGMWSTPTSPHSGIPPHLQPTEPSVTPPNAKPWMFNQFMNIMGGVAGKLYQFCSVPFRGFQAGGGQAYAFDNQEVAAKLGLQDNDDIMPQAPTQSIRSNDYRDNDHRDNNYGIESIGSLKEERPAAKRQRTAESWVVVGDQQDKVSSPSTPRITVRRAPGHKHSRSSSSFVPRPASRGSMTAPTHTRPSLIPVSRRTSLQGFSPVYARPHSRQSSGSTTFSGSKSSAKKSPLPPESQRLINKMRREESEDDARMRRMSSQMSAMLREAREALGSKFEIEDEYMDDGDDLDEDFQSNGMPLFPR